MKNDRPIYRGTVEYLVFRVTSDHEIDETMRASFDQVTWLDTEWVGPSVEVVKDGVTSHVRRARVLVDDTKLPAGPTSPVFFRIVDTPEIPKVKGDRNLRIYG